MSTSLVKQSLSLFDDDLESKAGKKVHAKGMNNKASKNLHQRTKKKRKKVFKSAIEKYKAEASVDHTSDNIAILKKVTEAGKTSQKYTTKVFGKMQEKDKKTQQTKSKPEQSVFTDDDFKKFAEEYIIPDS